MRSSSFSSPFMGMIHRIVCIVTLAVGSQLTVAYVASATGSSAADNLTAKNYSAVKKLMPGSSLLQLIQRLDDYTPTTKDGPKGSRGTGTR